MPVTWEDLPEDHPIFSTGPSFVFKNDLPPSTPDTSEGEQQPQGPVPEVDQEQPPAGS
jgi:hypothetical protein